MYSYLRPKACDFGSTSPNTRSQVDSMLGEFGEAMFICVICWLIRKSCNSAKIHCIIIDIVLEKGPFFFSHHCGCYD